MNNNARSALPFFKELAKKIEDQDFLTDKSGVKIVEVLCPKIVLDPTDLFIDFETVKSPREYTYQEESWYDSHELRIDRVSDVAIWKQVADSNHEINSNYGNLVFSRNNFSQFHNVLKTLSNHKESRQGLIIYTRPSIHYEWNSLGASDFICTNYQHFFIRNNKLVTVTSMRSNDSRFGFFNDIPWFHLVIQRMYEALKEVYSNLEIGDHIFIPNSFHVYERHFDVITKLAKEE